MGGVWFGKQLFLATLGVAVAEQARAARRRVSNIEVANAIEALGCWLALHHNGWGRDPRVRGANKMRHVAAQDLSFDRVRKPSFYVTQPMRQATIQPLRDLGLIESAGERFNGFTCSETGDAFINAVAGHLKPSSRSVTEHLISWVNGENVALNTPTLRQALSPMVELPRLSNAGSIIGVVDLVKYPFSTGSLTRSTTQKRSLSQRLSGQLFLFGGMQFNHCLFILFVTIHLP